MELQICVLCKYNIRSWGKIEPLKGYDTAEVAIERHNELTAA